MPNAFHAFNIKEGVVLPFLNGVKSIGQCRNTLGTVTKYIGLCRGNALGYVGEMHWATLGQNTLGHIGNKPLCAAFGLSKIFTDTGVELLEL